MTWARECEHCGGPIPDHKRAQAMYCSKACNVASSNAAHKAARLEAKAGRWCEWCGETMPERMKAGTRFCCVPCQRKARYHTDIEARPAQNCPACGSSFHPVHPAQTYCSRECANRSIGKDSPRPCQHCGETMPNPRKTQKFCNTRCQHAWHRARLRG